MAKIRRGPIKGESITYAATDRVEDYRQLATDFMAEVFDLLPADYLITDESTLRDFTEFGSSDTLPIWSRITEIYMINKSDAQSEKLVDIFAAIDRRHHVQ
jgi:hypothetical protein